MAALISGIILQVMNYVAKDDTVIQQAANAVSRVDVQTPDAILGIRLLLGPIPALFLILAGILVLFYPINEKKYQEIMAQRKAQQG